MAERAVFPLAARGVSITLGGHRALDGVDLDLPEPRSLAVLGANGAGKSVLLRVLHGLLPPDAGAITWGGRTERPREQAMVFQRPVMLRRSALANVEYALAVNGIAEPARIGAAREAIERVGLAHLADRPARVLSGGEQQRLALARAWALKPRVLFLDEPTASLDPAAATEVESVMRQIRLAGTAIVLTTHTLGLARRAADEIVFLHEGRITERTPAERFFRSPQSNEAERFLQGELP